ncbi:MAG: glycine cleavage system aminomethyltransferase GcvT, partial [Planctomycetia bacterium]
MGMRTPLYGWHEAHGGRIVDFGGWDMPVVYTSIVEEHNATRGALGLFDVSHMGRLRFFGADAVRFLDRVVTCSVADLAVGQVRYGLVLNEAGGVLDDVLVYRRPNNEYLLVVNASNRPKILDWLQRHQTGFNVEIVDATFDWSMIACQGPAAIETAQRLIEGATLEQLGNYRSAEAWFGGRPVLVSRTGYTGEDGVEMILAADAVVHLWESLVAEGGKAVGLGARDTLRLEAGMPLYGHELSETIDPVQAGLGRSAKPKATPFLGQEALADRPADRRVRVGLRVEGRRLPREGCAIVAAGATAGDEPIGVVTSGTFAPTVDAAVAMGYIAPAVAAVGAKAGVVVRDAVVPAEVVALP